TCRAEVSFSAGERNLLRFRSWGGRTTGGQETLQPGVPRRPPVEERCPMLSAPTAKVTPQGVHQWLQEFGWDVDSRRAKYPTKYKFNKNTKEQFKLIVREYSRMEEEKDSR